MNKKFRLKNEPWRVSKPKTKAKTKARPKTKTKRPTKPKGKAQKTSVVQPSTPSGGSASWKMLPQGPGQNQFVNANVVKATQPLHNWRTYPGSAGWNLTPPMQRMFVNPQLLSGFPRSYMQQVAGLSAAGTTGGWGSQYYPRSYGGGYGGGGGGGGGYAAAELPPYWWAPGLFNWRYGVNL